MLSRRDFLKFSAAGIPALAVIPDFTAFSPVLPVGRVAGKSVDVRRDPDSESPLILTLFKDTLIQILRTVEAAGPEGNRRWLQVDAGYIHSGDIQPVNFHPQIPAMAVEKMMPAEVCVPIAQSYRTIEPVEQILYRLYYKSVHWVKGVKLGKRNKVWYVLYDRQLTREYFAPGEYLRLIPPERYAPISTEVEPGKKRIEIRLADQTLTAYESDTVVLETKVSSGLTGSHDTATPTGTFPVQIKVAGVHMGNGQLTTDPLAYELPGVPWVSYFEVENGVALHGAYWHNDFGRPRSHGCINLPPEDALWLYRWTTPAAPEATVKGTGGYGTRILIR
ncbi:MAG: L,D-transpeptidase family protein [Anaerolineales bacterium]